MKAGAQQSRRRCEGFAVRPLLPIGLSDDATPRSRGFRALIVGKGYVTPPPQSGGEKRGRIDASEIAGHAPGISGPFGRGAPGPTGIRKSVLQAHEAARGVRQEQ